MLPMLHYLTLNVTDPRKSQFLDDQPLYDHESGYRRFKALATCEDNMVRLSGALTIQMQCLWKQKSQQQ
jgi:hypothetical protein